MHHHLVLFIGTAAPSITIWLDRFGVAAVFLFAAFENFGLPIPGETMLVVASAYAASGRHLSIVLVGIFYVAGMCVGSGLSYAAGARGGTALMTRLHVPEKHLGRAQAYMDRWGVQTIVFGKYVAFLRSYIGWLAGINKMAAAPFAVWTLLGSTLWTVTFCLIGFLIGNNWGLITRVLDVLKYGGLALVVVVVIVVFAVYRWRARVNAASADETDTDGA